MNVLNFNSEQCGRIRRHLDAYLSNELLVETTSEVLRHLESCEACSRELEARTRVRDALRRAAVSQVPPEELRQSIQRQLRKMQPGFLGGSRRLTWAVALAGHGCRPGRYCHRAVDQSATREANCGQRAGHSESRTISSVQLKGTTTRTSRTRPNNSARSSGHNTLDCSRWCNKNSPGSKFSKRTSARFRAARGSTFISSRGVVARFSP